MNTKVKKITTLALAAVLTGTLFAGCSSEGGNSSYGEAGSAGSTASQSSAAASDFDSSKDISVISREDGSGTRGAFIELFGLQEEQDGSKVDTTTEDAVITNSTNVMMTTVASDPYAIGYISLGSLNEDVKALRIDGAEASVENIDNGTYKIARPFNIATKKEGLSEVAQDFINFIMSSDGQKIIEEEGYIAVASDAAAYAGSKPSGKIVVAGSSSVTPVMEKLAEAYQSVNTGATVEVQQSDSITGMNYAIDGTCDIGMASRELKDSELEALSPTVIAQDGIVVVVNNGNPIDELTSDQVKSIFSGAETTWSSFAE